MKICPRCLSAYSDEALNFCLSDGTPLVEEEVYKLIQSQQLSQQSIDATIHPQDTAAKLTQQNRPSSPTLILEMPRKPMFKILVLVFLILVASLIVTLVFRSLRKEETKSEAVPTPRATISLQKTGISISPDKLEKIKQEVTQVLANWAQTNSSKDLEAHLSNYADVLDVYYSQSNKDKNYVRADRLRAYQKYNYILVQIENVEIFPDSESSVTAIFDKTWTMKGNEKISTGSVQQEMRLIKVGSKWLINSERDLKVYYINNRDLRNLENKPSEVNAEKVDSSTS